MKATLSEIRKTHKEPTVKGKKLEFKSTIWNIRNSQPVQNEEIRIQKNEERIRRLWDTSKHTNI